MMGRGFKVETFSLARLRDETNDIEPKEAMALVLRCLNDDPDERSCFGEIVQELSAIRSGLRES
jgi:hypothetical protein